MTAFRILQLLQILLGFYTWTLIGQGVLFLFTGYQGALNPVYRLFQQINFPARWVTRRVLPRFVLDRHITQASFALVILLRLLIYMAFFRAGAIPPMTPIGN